MTASGNTINEELANYLRALAERYETEDFIAADPSRFMHQVRGARNQEAAGFIAAALSYGNRKQFIPKIQCIMDLTGGEVHDWVKDGAFLTTFPMDNACFYRLYDNETMRIFLTALQALLAQYGSLGEFVQSGVVEGKADALSVLARLTAWFAGHESAAARYCKRSVGGVVPKNTQSCCKRLAMFLRWMTRDNSPVDLGLWADFIDKRQLIAPLDTHVLNEARRLGLMTSRTASMSAALHLTDKFRRIWPDDPLCGDFALFGLGVQGETSGIHE